MKHYTYNEWDLDHFKTLSPLSQDPTKELIHNRMGRLYWVTAKDSLYIERFSKANGPYQGRNLRFLRKIKPEVRTIIDIGMNVGNNTMEYSTWAENVHGFEPFPDTYKMAIANIELNQHVDLKGRYYHLKTDSTLHNPTDPQGWYKYSKRNFASLKMTGNITTYNEGLGEFPAILQMEAHPNNAGHNCILSESRKDKKTYELVEVTVNTLDSHNFTEVDIIKIDCEGYEFPILKGAINTIRTQRPIVQLEIVPKQCEKFNYTPQDLFDFFTKTIGNYSVYDFNGKKLPNDWERIKGVMDRFFVPDEVYV